MTTSYTVSVIVPTYNRGDLLRRSLECVFEQDYDDYEVIYVDDGSSDNTQEILGEFQVRYGSERLQRLGILNSGPGPARNRGVSSARGELILFTDDDTEPPRNWISGMVENRIKHGCDALSGGFVSLSTESRVEEYLDRRMKIIFGDTPKPIQAAPMMNFLVPRDLFIKAKGFSEDRLPAGEDWELCHRLAKNGATIFYDPSISVAHHYQAELEQGLKRMRETGACGMLIAKDRFNPTLYMLYSVTKFVTSLFWIPRRFPLRLYFIALHMEAAFFYARLRAYAGLLFGRRVLR